MKTNKKSTPNHSKQSKQEKNSSGTMKIFYVLMLVLMLSSSIIRITGASRHTQGGGTPFPQVSLGNNGGTAARVFVFHREDSGVNVCEDLVITSSGNAVYSNCGNGMEEQYVLGDTERSQLDNWIQQFQPVNYNHTDPPQVGNVTNQLYLNGQGSQQASESDIRKMIYFAETLAAKISAQP
jgi:hypothetical protein